MIAMNGDKGGVVSAHSRSSFFPSIIALVLLITFLFLSTDIWILYFKEIRIYLVKYVIWFGI